MPTATADGPRERCFPHGVRSTTVRSWPGSTGGCAVTTWRSWLRGSEHSGGVRRPDGRASAVTIADGLGLLIGIVVIATVADRLRIAYPILLVIAGVVIALLPVQHRVELQPDWVLLVFLPPLIYDASLDTSARELRNHWRPVLLLAVGLVAATMVAVAVVVHSLVGGMGWAVAFALGAIVSPPDSVAATQIAGKLGLPRQLVTILGGEGLMNDATALTAYQLAIAAVGTAFTLADAFGTFVFAVVVGVGIGIAVGWFGCRMLRFAETPVIENTMLLILPFATYLPAATLGASGGAGRGRHRPLLRPLRLGLPDRGGPAATAGDLGPDRLPADRTVLPPDRACVAR